MVASCALDERSIEEVSQGNDEVRRILAWAPPATSLILGPEGELLAELQVGGEGHGGGRNQCFALDQKQFHDVVGYYNRFDIFRLAVDQRPNRPVTLIRDESEATAARHEESRSTGEAPFATSPSNI